jgi:hypothetical protein
VFPVLLLVGCDYPKMESSRDESYDRSSLENRVVGEAKDLSFEFDRGSIQPR